MPTKKLVLAIAALTLTSGAAYAQLNVDLNIGQPAPVYVAPAPVYAPAYVEPYPHYYDPHHRGHDYAYWHGRHVEEHRGDPRRR